MLTPPSVVLRGDTIRIGDVEIDFQRTLRIPDDDHVWPLPPGLGRFPLRRIDDYRDRVPAAWREEGGFFLPMYQREAMWIRFTAPYWRPRALKVGVGNVNAVSGTRWNRTLSTDPQDYLVIPEQPWLDGINAGAGFIRQFVATPLGSGWSVEAQVTGEDAGGLRIAVVESKAGRFPTEPPPLIMRHDGTSHMLLCEAAPDMSLAAGGRMEQKIYPDPHGIDTWDLAQITEVRVRIVNSEQFARITGEAAPTTPVSVETYMQYRLPWFALYDEHKGDVAAPSALRDVRSLDELEAVTDLS